MNTLTAFKSHLVSLLKTNCFANLSSFDWVAWLGQIFEFECQYDFYFLSQLRLTYFFAYFVSVLKSRCIHLGQSRLCQDTQTLQTKNPSRFCYSRPKYPNKDFHFIFVYRFSLLFDFYLVYILLWLQMTLNLRLSLSFYPSFCVLQSRDHLSLFSYVLKLMNLS